MDVQAEKLSLIEWITKIDDEHIIRQIRALQNANQNYLPDLSNEEKLAIDIGLKSIEEGKVHSHESVMKSTKEKYPQLFK